MNEDLQLLIMHFDFSRERQTTSAPSLSKHVPWLADPQERQDAPAVRAEQLVWGAQTELEADLSCFEPRLFGHQLPQYLRWNCAPLRCGSGTPRRDQWRVHGRGLDPVESERDVHPIREGLSIRIEPERN